MGTSPRRTPRRRVVLLGAAFSSLVLAGVVRMFDDGGRHAAGRSVAAASRDAVHAHGVRDAHSPRATRDASASRRAAALAWDAHTASHAPRAFDAEAVPLDLHALRPRPLAAPSLQQAHGKELTKAQKAIDKTTQKIAKIEAQTAHKEDLLELRELELVEAEDILDLVTGFLDLAEQELAEALALPESTPEEILAKEAAVAHATEGVALATKEVALRTQHVAAKEKAIAKLEQSLDMLADSLAAAEDLLLAHQDELARLSEPFPFVATVDVPFEMHVLLPDASPVVGARVQVVDVLPAPKGKKAVETLSSGSVHWQGFTDADGRCAATLVLPPSLAQIDVVADAPGLSGAYTHEAHRTRAGVFAPSARVTLSVDTLSAASLVLEDAP